MTYLLNKITLKKFCLVKEFSLHFGEAHIIGEGYHKFIGSSNKKCTDTPRTEKYYGKISLGTNI